MASQSKHKENLYQRSGEVQEIIDTPPPWLVRWGITVIFTIACCLLGISFLIKYPEYITTEIVITAGEPSEYISARTSGQIETVLVSSGDTIKSGEPLLLMKNSAKSETILALDAMTYQIDNLFSFPIDSILETELGEIKPAFINFRRHYNNYKNALNQDPISNSLDREKVSKMENRDIPSNNNESALKLEDSERHSTEGLVQSFYELKLALSEWKQKYAVSSFNAGVVLMNKDLEINQTILAGDHLFTTVSGKTPALYGKLYIQNRDKLKLGEDITIKLNTYPYKEYGNLDGKVTSVSTMPMANGNYEVTIDLAEKFVRIYGKKISSGDRLVGNVEIQTEVKSLAERIVSKLKPISGN